MKLLVLISLFATLSAMNEKQVYDIASRHSKSPEIVTAIAKTESRLKDNQKSGYGALGIMQVIPSTAKYISSKHKELSFVSRMSDAQLRHFLLTNNYYNVVIGAKYYEYLHERYSTKKAISKYNTCSTDKYYNKVMENL